jgi:Tfp pilus assembly protein PilF
VALLAIAMGAPMLCGCSINLGSLAPEPDKEPAIAAPSGAAISDARIHNSSGQALARAGKNHEALAQFDEAIILDPHNADAFYNRGLVYQAVKQHQLAIDDFTAANGLTPQRAEPLLARAISFLAVDKVGEAVGDLDEAVQADPRNPQIWTTRGLAYERLGNKSKAAESYGHAINLRPDDEAAQSGFIRVGGKPGQSE